MNDTEEKIRNSALKYFLRYGFKKSSIDEIAEDAGIGKGTVYNYFSNKQELFTKTSIWWRETQFKKIEIEINKIEPADDKILMLLNLEVSSFRKAFKEYGMTAKVMCELISLKQSNEILQKRDIDLYQSYLILGHKQGIFYKQPFREYAELLNNIIFQFAERWIIIMDESDASKEIKTLIGLMLKAMKA